MKKILIFIFCITLSWSLCIPVNAQENKTVYSGYTSDGIYYTVHDIETQAAMTRTKGDTLYVVREFEYDGIVKPSTTIEWSEQNKGITYTGTLNLITFSFSGGNTIATYEGTLTAIN